MDVSAWVKMQDYSRRMQSKQNKSTLVTRSSKQLGTRSNNCNKAYNKLTSAGGGELGLANSEVGAESGRQAKQEPTNTGATCCELIVQVSELAIYAESKSNLARQQCSQLERLHFL